MQLDYKIIEDFKTLTSKDIAPFLKRCISFFSTEYPAIVDFYTGKKRKVKSEDFKKFALLEDEKNQIFEIFDAHSQAMKNSKWWALVEELESIDSQLSTLRHINKWARSSLTTVGYSPYMQIEYVLNQNETLERVSKDVMQSQSLDSWVDIAIDNRLEEEDYTIEGGNLINLYFERNNNTYKVLSVVDIIRGKSIYGKDIDKTLHFATVDPVEGYGDVVVLDYDETILQAVSILILLKRNSNPDAPNSGLQSTIAIGGNRATLNFPILNRQLTATFATDDTLKNFIIKNIEFKQDQLLIDYTVQTRLDEVINQQDILL